MKRRGRPRSLLGQMLLAVAAALLLAQAIGAALLYRAQTERRDAALVHTAAFRLLSATRDPDTARGHPGDRPAHLRPGHGMQLEHSETSPLRPADVRDEEAEHELRQFLAEQDGMPADVIVVRRDVRDDPPALRRLAHRREMFTREERPPPRQVMIAGVQDGKTGQWTAARVMVPSGHGSVIVSLIGQTLLIYGVLVGTIALILNRITRPIAALTRRLDRFTATRSPEGQIIPEGPDDVRRLIMAHNAMESRISALLDEKDVMLGAIGHDLKTPLAALRVRIESVEDDTERSRMAATIEDIVRSLDDILSLARVGRPSDPLEHSELSALVASVVEEFEDMGEPVELGETQRIALPLRATWLRRALRNLIGNGLRYGKRARISVTREDTRALVRIEDDGPGIAEADIARLQEPFTRGEPSRNTETGGTGLGLTLARAIAEQHGGTLTLANRRTQDGSIAGLTATLALPLEV